MRRLPNGEFDRDVLHAVEMIKKYDRITRSLLRNGFSYWDDVVNAAHNGRARWMNKIEEESEYQLLVKVWNNGTVRVYDRYDYLRKTQGRKVANQWRMYHPKERTYEK